MTKTSLFLIICTVLLLGNLYIAQTSGANTNEIIIHSMPVPDPDGGPDIKNEEEMIEYTCITTSVGNSSTVIFQQKRRGSEQWKTIPDEKLNRTQDLKNINSVKLEFKADFTLHNGTTFRCLIKENQTDPEPIQFDLIVVHRTDRRSGLNQIPTTEITTSRVRLVTAVGSKIYKTGHIDQTVLDDNDRTTSDRTTSDWTMMIVSIACGILGFLLFIVIIVVIIIVIVILRRRVLFGEGRVDTTTPQRQTEMVYEVYDELYDDIDSVTETDKLHTSDQKVTTDPYANIEAGNGKDTARYMDMTARKGKDTTSYINMEAGKGKDPTPYLDIEDGDTDTTPYMDMEAGKGKDTLARCIDMEAGEDTDRYMNLQTEDTDEPVKHDNQLYSNATVE
ncbi:uncharacterized protein LOC141906643 [Tubulanus polymorphus]|uniref:uncharacterized protein LOC141906643 n=1 Tax=Tubulanus polymorphus TaxID=672921 RepID=UPI003DA534AE